MSTKVANFVIVMAINVSSLVLVMAINFASFVLVMVINVASFVQIIRESDKCRQRYIRLNKKICSFQVTRQTLKIPTDPS
jgi:hypothetical protein